MYWQTSGMGAQVEIIVPRYVVLTQLAGSWIPRASHGDAETAEAEAFRWRRIYGPSRTRVAEYLVSDTQMREPVAPARPLFPPPTTAPRAAVTPCACPPWHGTVLRVFALYLVFGLVNRSLELFILLAQR